MMHKAIHLTNQIKPMCTIDFLKLSNIENKISLKPTRICAARAGYAASSH
jgi:hypothetical protein